MNLTIPGFEHLRDVVAEDFPLLDALFKQLDANRAAGNVGASITLSASVYEETLAQYIRSRQGKPPLRLDVEANEPEHFLFVGRQIFKGP
jgi:hypothetical protein